jgi:murein DD-endopeptidase MepM/ murein hydrolase activator NlpD
MQLLSHLDNDITRRDYMRALLPAVIATSCLFSTAAEALEVRFYPGERVYAYEASAAHNASTIVVHNIAIINDGAEPVVLNDVNFELMQGDRVLDERTLGTEQLTRAAAGAAGIQQAGLLDVLAFQFGGSALLPANTTLSADLTLDPGEAVLLTSQIFAFTGARDGLRVRVNGDAAEGRLAIRTGLSQTQFQMPLRGAWYNASGASFHTHHRWTPMEEFAFDLIRLDANGASHRRSGTRFSDYFAYGEPVFAAAAGRVAFVVSDQREYPEAMQQPGETIEVYFERLQQDQFTRIAQGPPGVGGNQIIIDHGNGEFSFYGHLQPGSVRVRVGDQVERGARIGAVGSSGNSTEPHLHFHVCNSADPLMCAGIPVQWDRTYSPMPDPPRALQSGDFMVTPAE